MGELAADIQRRSWGRSWPFRTAAGRKILRLHILTRSVIFNVKINIRLNFFLDWMKGSD